MSCSSRRSSSKNSKSSRQRTAETIIKIDLSVTSYETNDDGEPLKDTDGNFISAESSTTVEVDVQAVTDATPDLKILGKDTPDNLSKTDLEAAIGSGITLDGSGGTVPGGVTVTEESGVPHITIAEDSGTLKLDSTFITAKLESASDTDGSEPLQHHDIGIGRGNKGKRRHSRRGRYRDAGKRGNDKRRH